MPDGIDVRWAKMPLQGDGFVGDGELEALEEVALIRGDALVPVTGVRWISTR